MKYIHYGSKSFERETLARSMTDEKKFHRHDKPHGLWASPVDAEWGWKDWCKSEDFNVESLNTSFSFSISEKARVLHVHHLDDVERYMKVKHNFGLFVEYELDLPKLYKHFDAMELHISDDYCNFRDTNVFYTWDVDSIVIWNPDIVIC